MKLYEASAATAPQASSKQKYLGLYDDSIGFRQSKNGINSVTAKTLSREDMDIVIDRCTRIPVILQSLDGLSPADLRLLHDELDVVLAHICKGDKCIGLNS